MFPCACQRDDLSGGLLRWAVGRDHNEPFEAPQPLALIRGVTACPDDQRLDRLVLFGHGWIPEVQIRAVKQGRDRHSSAIMASVNSSVEAVPHPQDFVRRARVVGEGS